MTVWRSEKQASPYYCLTCHINYKDNPAFQEHFDSSEHKVMAVFIGSKPTYDELEAQLTEAQSHIRGLAEALEAIEAGSEDSIAVSWARAALAALPAEYREVK